jgi:hypothetical protein
MLVWLGVSDCCRRPGILLNLSPSKWGRIIAPCKQKADSHPSLLALVQKVYYLCLSEMNSCRQVDRNICIDNYIVYSLTHSFRGDFWGMIGQNPSVSKSNQLEVVIFQSFFINFYLSEFHSLESSWMTSSFFFWSLERQPVVSQTPSGHL